MPRLPPSLGRASEKKEGSRMTEHYDISSTIVPKSDQLNADDLLTGPRTVTVEKVSAGSAEQPVNVHLVEFPGRPFRPSKTVRRIMVSAWGVDAANYAGRRMTLYRDPAVRFGGQDVGGIRVSHMSHIAKRITLALAVTRGKRSPYVVDPLPDPPPSAPEQLITSDQLKRLWPLLSDAGLTKPAEALAWMGNVVERAEDNPLLETKNLTDDEAERILAQLEDQLTQGE